MKDLIRDTLIWFGGFIAVSVTLLTIARKLMQRARSYEIAYRKMIASADVPAAADPSTDDPFAAGLSALAQSSAPEPANAERQLLADLICVQEPQSQIVNWVILVACGSFAGGLMWSLTSEPRSWYGLMIGGAIAIVALMLGLWLHSRTAVSHSPSLRMSWADLLEILSLRWESAGPQTEMIHKTALALIESDPELSAFVSQSASIPFDESPFWKLLTGFHAKPWPATPTEQACVLRGTACLIRQHLAQAMRFEAKRIARMMKLAIWLFMAPALYVVVLTPPVVELAMYLQVRSSNERDAAPTQVDHPKLSPATSDDRRHVDDERAQPSPSRQP